MLIDNPPSDDDDEQRPPGPGLVFLVFLVGGEVAPGRARHLLPLAPVVSIEVTLREIIIIIIIIIVIFIRVLVWRPLHNIVQVIQTLLGGGRLVVLALKI